MTDISENVEIIDDSYDPKVMDKELSEIEIMDRELSDIDKLKELRLEIDAGIERNLQELAELEKSLSKEQTASLIKQCGDSAINAVVSNFGLAAAVITNKDGGNVDTTHNARQVDKLQAQAKQEYKDQLKAAKTDHERQVIKDQFEAKMNKAEGLLSNEANAKYAAKEKYNPDEIHQDSRYKARNKELNEQKAQGKAMDYMTDKPIDRNAKTDSDHIYPGKKIHEDRSRVLADVGVAELANVPSNIELTDSSYNRSKQDKSIDEMLQHRDKRLNELEQAREKRGHLTQSEEKEFQKLLKQKEINDEAVRKRYNEEKKRIKKTIDKRYYTSLKPYKQGLKTGAEDGAKMVAYTALGLVLKEFLIELFNGLKTILKDFGNKSFRDIYHEFKTRINNVWEKLKVKFKDILASSLEAGILAFFSNFIVFLCNIVFTTLKRLVRIIRAGFNSLYQAVKFIINPPKNVSKEDVLYEASKIFITGLIASITMLSSEAIEKFLYAVPGFGIILNTPLPFSNDTIGSALSLCISAAAGAVLSTIVIYYMDQFRNKGKDSKIYLQLVTTSGVAVQYKTAQSYFALLDGYHFLSTEAQRMQAIFKAHKDEYEESHKKVEESSNKLDNALFRLRDMSQNNKG